MKAQIFLVLILAGLLINCQKPQVIYPEPLSQMHQNVLDDIFRSQPERADVDKYLGEMKEDGSWADIDYTSKERGGWEPSGHLSRILTIAKAYQTPKSGYYQKKSVGKKIHLSLNFWLDNDFQCPNWWYPEIGVPMILAPAMILMEAELSPEQMEKGMKILARSSIGMTGQNKVWQSGNVLLRSLLQKDEETIRSAANAIQEELVVSTGEGVQPDWSYHQHGPQLQFGNYGLAYVGDMIKWISILRNTPFQFDENKVSILRNYLLEGQQWVTWKNMYDISSCGRQVFPNAQVSKAGSLARNLSRMEEVDPAFADNYRNANDYSTLSGNRHFWRSDVQIQRTPEYYFSVKMCSERVIGAESCNAENIQGYYMGDGATFLYQTTDEYKDIFPFWDWKKIPGTTTHQDNDTLPVLTARGYRIPVSFVGGVSDGKNGIAVMDYQRNGLKARKSWFMFNDMIVALGADITSSENLPVVTTVNQSFLRGTVTVKTGNTEKIPGESESISDPVWILHDQTGYLFPQGGSLFLEAKNVEGSWHWSTSRFPEEILKADLFRLWFEHGTNPSGKSYQYILVPDANVEKLNQLENNKPFVLLNEKNVQQVVASDGKTAGIVFYTKGKTQIFGGIQTDQPCVMMIRETHDGIGISLADPTQLLEKVILKIGGNYNAENAKAENGVTTLTVNLPIGEDAGKSVTALLRKI